VRVVVICLSLSFVVACQDITREVPCVLDGADAGVPDAGFCAPADLFGDVELAGGEGEGEALNGPELDAALDAQCSQLIVAVCGGADECINDPACVAANLLNQFQQEGCLDAQSNAASYPPCTAGTCALLVDKVCGSGDPQACVDAPSCPLATALLEREDGGDSSAASSCGSALADETLFPGCPSP